MLRTWKLETWNLKLSLPSATDRRQDRNFTILWKRRLKQLLPPHVVLIKKNIDVLAQVSLLIQHSVTQARMLAPEDLQRFTQLLRVRVHADLVLPGSEVS